MKRLMTLSGALVLGTLFLSGCSLIGRKPAPPRARTFALAVTVQGTLQPTPGQFAAIQAAAVKELSAQGLVLVSDLALADRIIRVDFTPNPNNPENSGRAVVLGFMPNPYRTLTTISPVHSVSYRPTYFPTPWSGGYDSRYHYYDPMYAYSWYSDGYTYNAPSGALVPVTPPAAPPPRRADPPSRDDSVRQGGGGHPATSRFGGYSRGDYSRVPRDPPSSSRHDPPPSSYSGSGSSSGSSYSSYSDSSSGSSYSSSSSSSYSSSSGASYSPPSHSDASDSTRRSVEP